MAVMTEEVGREEDRVDDATEGSRTWAMDGGGEVETVLERVGVWSCV